MSSAHRSYLTSALMIEGGVKAWCSCNTGHCVAVSGYTMAVIWLLDTSGETYMVSAEGRKEEG